LLVTMVLVCAACAGGAIEPWADQGLPVSGGLMVWLDAGRQGAAWNAHQKALVGDDRLDVVFDGSGMGRDFVQTVKEAQPRFVSGKNHCAIRFDGKGNHLVGRSGKLELNEFTAFVVAAARANKGSFCALLSANETGRNDYASGFNIDLGPKASGGYGGAEFLNVE